VKAKKHSAYIFVVHDKKKVPRKKAGCKKSKTRKKPDALKKGPAKMILDFWRA
jgi:hypothetical protein